MSGLAQLFAYEIDTHDSSKINSILMNRGIDPNEMTQEQYLHQQVNLQSRLIRDEVLSRAQSQALSVFLAPEFFFKWRDGQPYDRATFFNSLNYFATASAQVPSVLWVTGTIWWKEPIDAATARVHNTALIYQHGRLLHSWQKERLSQIDGLDQGPEEWDRWDVASTRVLEDTQDPFLEAPISGAGTMSVGIEVCLDHLTLAGPPRSYGVLRTKYVAAHPDPSDGPGVDIHLLVAAGMKMQTENITSRSGGVLFRADGGVIVPPNTRSDCVLVSRLGADPARALRLWNPTTVRSVPTYVGTDGNNRLAVYDPVVVP